MRRILTKRLTSVGSFVKMNTKCAWYLDEREVRLGQKKTPQKRTDAPKHGRYPIDMDDLSEDVFPEGTPEAYVPFERVWMHVSVIL